jgi:hypothetical protein
MYPKDLSTITDPGVRKRIAVERRIVLALIDRALDEGYELSVYDGDHAYLWTRDRDAVIADIMETDDDYLRVRKRANDGTLGWVRLVYGNDGWDVICDYTTNLEALLAPVLALAESLED